jgi:hypothetical protein
MVQVLPGVTAFWLIKFSAGLSRNTKWYRDFDVDKADFLAVTDHISSLLPVSK